MCERGDREQLEIAGRVRDIDACIFPIVKALNQAGIETVASCCGHGMRPGRITMIDGRELIIAGSFEQAHYICGMFPLNINGDFARAHNQGVEGEPQ